MKRHLLFKENEVGYLIDENQKEMFDISKSDLKFDSLKFYNSIFKNTEGYQDIFFTQDESTCSKTADYIYRWVSEIINNICTALNEGLDAPITEEETILELPTKIIKLYTLSACAGDGIYAMDGDSDFGNIKVHNVEADYAVRISGQSMEPQILDNAIVLVKETGELMDGDIGIFNIDGESMCKKYTESEGTIILVPINEKFKPIAVNEHTVLRIQGKVLETVEL